MVVFQNMSQGPPSSLLQVAVKNNQQPVWYFNDKVSLHVFFTEEGRMERANFLEVKLHSSPVGFLSLLLLHVVFGEYTYHHVHDLFGSLKLKKQLLFSPLLSCDTSLGSNVPKI